MTVTKVPSLVWYLARQIPTLYLVLMSALVVALVVGVAIVIARRRSRRLARERGAFVSYDVERAVQESISDASAPEWEALPEATGSLKGGSDEYIYDARDFEGTEETKGDNDEVHSPMIHNCHRELDIPQSEIEMREVGVR